MVYLKIDGWGILRSLGISIIGSLVFEEMLGVVGMFGLKVEKFGCNVRWVRVE